MTALEELTKQADTLTNPYIERWATGQSDWDQVYQRIDDPVNEGEKISQPFVPPKWVNKWESRSDLFGIHFGLELEF